MNEVVVNFLKKKFLKLLVQQTKADLIRENEVNDPILSQNLSIYTNFSIIIRDNNIHIF
jgi:hypothetical protein